MSKTIRRKTGKQAEGFAAFKDGASFDAAYQQYLIGNPPPEKWIAAQKRAVIPSYSYGNLWHDPALRDWCNARDFPFWTRGKTTFERYQAEQLARYHSDHGVGNFWRAHAPSDFRRMCNRIERSKQKQQLRNALQLDNWDDFILYERSSPASYDYW